MNPIRISLALILALFSGFARSQEVAEATQNSLSHPWEERTHRLTLAEYEATLEFWVEQHPGWLSLERRGESETGMGIYLLRITDTTVPDGDKQVALVTSLHGGPERSGTNAAMHLVEWLLSDTPDAARTRENQIVLVMPIVNPHAFFVTDRFGNPQGIDPYTGGANNWDLETMTYTALNKAPEVAAVLSVMDEYRPEVHADLHGVGLQEYPEDQLGDRTQYRGQTMFEVTGSAYSNMALRPWDWRVTEAMIAAGEAAGYGSDRFEADAQEMYWGPGLNPIAGKTWRGRPLFYTAQYGYAKYHTLMTTLEIGWEASGVARMRGLLDVGNTVWNGESHVGYPVDRVKSFVGHFVTAVGETAAARRQSRVELWNRRDDLSVGILYPQTEGRETFLCALGPAGKAVLAEQNPAMFVESLAGRDDIDRAALGQFVEAGPEIKVVAEAARGDQPCEALQHGIGFRMRIPYRNPTITDVRLNGRALARDAAQGYATWYGNGFTQLQVTVPPDATADMDLFLVTVAYEPDVRREYGWQPPEAVMKRLQAPDQ